MYPPIDIIYSSDRCIVGQSWRGGIADAGMPYEGFNVCHYTGDSNEHIADCRKALGRHFGIEADNVVVPRQVHGTEIAVVDTFDFDRCTLEGIDAVISSSPGLIIGVNTADCIPIILWDEEIGIIAAIHAGWRGAIAGIVEKSVGKMLGLGAKAISAYIGVGICSDCFEVGEEVAERFSARFVVRRSGEKPHVDLPAYVAHALRSAGVANIIQSTDCTRHMSDRYFSARALGIASGRNFTFAMLK